MNIPFESAAIYVIGFIGLAAVGLLPYRSWLLMIAMFNANVPQVRKRLMIVVAVLACAFALWSVIQVVARIFSCLTEGYCGPGVASGWGYLAILGAVYLAFEGINFVLRRATTWRV